MFVSFRPVRPIPPQVHCECLCCYLILNSPHLAQRAGELRSSTSCSSTTPVRLLSGDTLADRPGVFFKRNPLGLEPNAPVSARRPFASVPVSRRCLVCVSPGSDRLCGGFLSRRTSDKSSPSDVQRNRKKCVFTHCRADCRRLQCTPPIRIPVRRSPVAGAY